MHLNKHLSFIGTSPCSPSFLHTLQLTSNQIHFRPINFSRLEMEESKALPGKTPSEERRDQGLMHMGNLNTGSGKPAQTDGGIKNGTSSDFEEGQVSEEDEDKR